MPPKISMQKGAQYGRWTIIEPDLKHPNKPNDVNYYCLCECSCEKHTQMYINSSKLRNGKSLSCGCIRRENLALRNAEQSSVKVGNRYGKLTIIKDLGMRKQLSRDKNERWSLCQCDCGSAPIEVKNNMLQNGWKKSCGCLHSEGERIVEQVLQKYNFQYIKEYRFQDLTGDKNGLLRFDFAVFQNNQLLFLIEVDGRQHYDGPEATWTKGHSLEEILKYDHKKNEYCLEHNIILKRIPYFLLGIVDDNILTDKFNITKDRWRYEKEDLAE